MSCKIGFIGAGNMGEALIGGVIEGGIAKPSDICIYEVKQDRADFIVNKYGVKNYSDLVKMIDTCDKIFIAVKPQNIPEMLQAIGKCNVNGKLFISICAGILTQTLEAGFPGGEAHVIRVMPNTPAMIKAGASALAKGKYTTDEDMKWGIEVFGKVGIAVEVKEEMINAVTGLSGSGPAYVFRMIEGLIAGGVECGLPEETAELLAKQTVLGAARLAMESSKNPTQLREAVTSPGGTTAAGLKMMEEGGFYELMIATIKAATERGRELGKQK